MSVVPPQHPGRAALALLVAGLCMLLASCARAPGPASVSGGPPGYSWFERSGPLDPWAPKIAGWQHRAW